MTVAKALTAAGLSAEGYEIHVSGNPASTSTVLEHGQTVLLLQRIRGNR